MHFLQTIAPSAGHSLYISCRKRQSDTFCPAICIYTPASIPFLSSYSHRCGRFPLCPSPVSTDRSIQPGSFQKVFYYPIAHFKLSMIEPFKETLLCVFQAVYQLHSIHSCITVRFSLQQKSCSALLRYLSIGIGPLSFIS